MVRGLVRCVFRVLFRDVVTSVVGCVVRGVVRCVIRFVVPLNDIRLVLWSCPFDNVRRGIARKITATM